MESFKGKDTDFDAKLIDSLSVPEECYGEDKDNLGCYTSKRTVDSGFFESGRMKLIRLQDPRLL